MYLKENFIEINPSVSKINTLLYHNPVASIPTVVLEYKALNDKTSACHSQNSEPNLTSEVNLKQNLIMLNGSLMLAQILVVANVCCGLAQFANT